MILRLLLLFHVLIDGRVEDVSGMGVTSLVFSGRLAVPTISCGSGDLDRVLAALVETALIGARSASKADVGNCCGG